MDFQLSDQPAYGTWIIKVRAFVSALVMIDNYYILFYTDCMPIFRLIEIGLFCDKHEVRLMPNYWFIFVL